MVHICREKEIHVGALGELKIKKGYYIYIGRAKKGLISRVKRHFSYEKRKRWHIDYLIEHSCRIGAYIFPGADASLEEEIATFMTGIYPHILGFGSSDSKAKSHLFFTQSLKDALKAIEIIRNKFSLPPPIVVEEVKNLIMQTNRGREEKLPP